MIKKLIIFLLIAAVCWCKPIYVSAQLKTYKFEQIDSLQKIETRPLFIFINTTWCKYCVAMKQTTFNDKSIITILNKKYYTVFLDAETNEDIFFNNHLFKYKATGYNIGSHELAEQLASINGQIAFPTICILNLKTEIIFQRSNFIAIKELKQFLKKINF